MSFSLVVYGTNPSLMRRWLKCENNPHINGVARDVPPLMVFAIFVGVVPLLFAVMIVNPVTGSASEHMSGETRRPLLKLDTPAKVVN
jgi:hypothetical protein